MLVHRHDSLPTDASGSDAPSLMLCPFAEEHELGPGSELARSLEVPATVQQVRTGLVALTSGWGRQTGACAVRGAGFVVGTEAVGSRPAEHRAVALTEVAVWRVPGHRFVEWVEGTSDFTSASARALRSSVHVRAEERTALLGSALRRVASFLLRAHDIQRGAPIGVASHVVATVLRMRPETFSRAVTSLRRRGLLGGGAALQVVDEAGLRAIEEIR
jgi:CRP-like cAMP-binding protein